MRPLIVSIAIACLAVTTACSDPTQAATAGTGDLFLVKDGKPRSVIVAPAQPSPQIQDAIDELQYHLHRASGVTLPIVDQTQSLAPATGTLRIIFKENTKLPAETFQVKTQDDTLIFTGDGRDNSTLQWAVDHYLDTQLGVRWLWPGEVGTHVPKHATVALPQLDYTGRPTLEQRSLRTSLAKRSFKNSPIFLTQSEHEQGVQETQAWLRRFQVGNRSRYRFGHAFSHWWGKYSETHPDYFAVPPAGSKYQQPWPQPGRVKLRLGNEAIDDAIIAEWKTAGAPDNWNVCPNDGSGFDTSDVTRALDDPPNQDPNLIWRTAKAKLTTRYIKFWNRLIVKMKKINPNVQISSYAYSAYRDPPMHGSELLPGIVLGLVPSYWAQDHWQEWQRAGAMLFLRPNWWHTGGVAPVLPLHQQGEFFKFAQSHNMVGFDSDSLMGYWATQGPMYYVIARLMVRPEMSVDEIINEYSSAFGKAAPEIKSYLSYWENFTTEAAYPAPAGGAAEPVQPGLVNQLITQHKLSASPLAHGWQVIPYLYTDEVLKKGHAILDQADTSVGSDDSFVKQRIQFLRDGLIHLELTRDVLQLGYLKQRTPEQQEEYETRSAELLQMRKVLTPKHVIWGEAEYAAEVRRRVPTITETTLAKQEELSGL